MRDYLQKVSLRELRLLLFGLTAIVVAAVIAGLVVPRMKALHSANREVSVLEEAVQEGAELERHLQEQHARIEDLKYRLHGDMANLPARQVEAYVIGRLQRVSWNNGVELVSVEPALGERVQIFQEMLFNVELAGKYADLYRWMLDAREELGYVVVKEYSLARRDNNDEEPQLLAQLSLASYRAAE